MWNEPMKEDLDQIPRLYATEDIPPEVKTIHLHFFLFGCDWFIAEFDGEDLFWGFAILNNDYEMAEWGYISFTEIKDLRVNGFEIDRDLFWEPKPACEVEEICRVHNWPLPGGAWLSNFVNP